MNWTENSHIMYLKGVLVFEYLVTFHHRLFIHFIKVWGKMVKYVLFGDNDGGYGSIFCIYINILEMLLCWRGASFSIFH